MVLLAVAVLALYAGLGASRIKREARVITAEENAQQAYYGADAAFGRILARALTATLSKAQEFDKRSAMVTALASADLQEQIMMMEPPDNTKELWRGKVLKVTARQESATGTDVYDFTVQGTAGSGRTAARRLISGTIKVTPGNAKNTIYSVTFWQ